MSAARSLLLAADVLTLDADLEDVGQQLIEDNIVSVSRQMIDKEASMANTNGASNGTNGAQKGEMDVDDEL